jgi:hypothetical protein
VKLALFGHTIFPGVPLKESISEDFLTPDFMASWGSWRRIGFTWLQGAIAPPYPSPAQPWPQSIRYYDARFGGIGYLWVLGCVPAVAYVVFSVTRDWLRRPETVSIEPAAVLSVLFVVFGAFAAVPMNWWCRYTMWIYAAGLPCLGLVIDRIWAARRGVAPVLMRAWVLGAFAVGIFEAAYAFRYAALAGQFIVFAEPVTWTPSGVWHALTVYNDPKYLFLNMSPMDEEVVRRADAVAMAQLDVGGGPLLGVLSMPVGLRDIVLLSWDIANDEAKLRSLLLEHRVRYLFWNDSLPVPSPVARLSRRDSRTPGYWRLFEVGPGAPLGPTDVRAK